MEHMVFIMHLRWLAASIIRVELEILSRAHENSKEQKSSCKYSIIIINYRNIINARYNYIINAQYY